MFQLNFSNGFGTTLAQVARGGSSERRLVSWLQSFEEILLMTKVMQGLAAAIVVALTAAACGGGSSTPTTPTPTRRRRPTDRTESDRRRRSRSAPMAASSPASVTIAPGGRVTMINNHSQLARHVVGSASRAHAVPGDQPDWIPDDRSVSARQATSTPRGRAASTITICRTTPACRAGSSFSRQVGRLSGCRAVRSVNGR